MLGVAPASAVRPDVLLGAFLESQRFGSVEGDLGTLAPPRLDRVYARVGEPPAFCRLDPGLGQAEGRERAQAHLSGPAAKLEPAYPGFRDVGVAVAGHLQIEAGAVGVHARRFRPQNLERGEPTHKLRHVRPTGGTHNSTHAANALTHTFGRTRTDVVRG